MFYVKRLRVSYAKVLLFVKVRDFVERSYQALTFNSYKPDIKMYTIIMNKFSKGKMLDQALEILEMMKWDRVRPDLHTYYILYHMHASYILYL